MQQGIEDRFGLDMCTSSTLAAEHYVEGVDLMLSRNYGSEEKFDQAVEADEGFAVAYASKAMMQLYRGKGADAKATAERARTLSLGASRRVQGYAEAVFLYVSGEGPRALARAREHMNEFPRDAMALQLAHRLLVMGCGVAGVPNFPPEMLGLLKGLEPVYGDEWSFLGNYAFAHHESGLFDEALRLAERSLEQRPDNANASHSVAHVFFERGDHVTGQGFLGNWLEDYDSRSPFYVHLSWHEALFELAQGRHERALGLYENAIRPSVVAKSPISIADSCSLMWRLQIYGGSVPPMPWEEVRDQAAPALSGKGPAFGVAHAAMACAASGDDETWNQMIEGIKGMASDGNLLASEVTLPLVKGIGAFSQGDYAESARLIGPIHSQFVRLGGSHAQREVFEDTLLAAYLRSEQYDKAEDMLRERLNRRTSVRDTLWLSGVQVNTGQTEAASVSVNEVRQGWQNADADSPEIVALDSLG